jgi:hypothetical protein
MIAVSAVFLGIAFGEATARREDFRYGAPPPIHPGTRGSIGEQIRMMDGYPGGD